MSCMHAADVRSSSEAQRSGDMPSSAEDFKLAAIHGDLEEGIHNAIYMEHHCSRRQQKAMGLDPEFKLTHGPHYYSCHDDRCISQDREPCDAGVWHISASAVAGDAALYKDLLRKAHGNEAVAKSWMREICGHDVSSPTESLIAARMSHSPAPIYTYPCFQLRGRMPTL